MRPESLESIMRRGGDPLEDLDDFELDELAEATIARGGREVTFNDRTVEQLIEMGEDRVARRVAWHIEIATRRDVRDWIASLLPSYVVAVRQIRSDMSQRRHVLHVERGPHHCGNCGHLRSGWFLVIVDRAGLDDDWRLEFCCRCIAKAVRGPAADTPAMGRARP